MSAGKHVISASGVDPDAGVAVVADPEGLDLRVSGKRVGTISVGPADRPVSLSNAACARRPSLSSSGFPPRRCSRGSTCMPSPPNRLQRYAADGGYTVLDDTFNSNPAGSRVWP